MSTAARSSATPATGLSPGWPLGSLVLIGYLVGFQIITCGVARIAIALATRHPAAAKTV